MRCFAFTRCLPLLGNQSSKCLVLWIPRGYRLLDTLIPTCYLLLPERLMLDCRVQGEMCHPCSHRWRCPSSRQPRPDCFRGCVAVERCGRMRLASFGCSRWRDSNTPRRQPPAWQKKTRLRAGCGVFWCVLVLAVLQPGVATTPPNSPAQHRFRCGRTTRSWP